MKKTIFSFRAGIIAAGAVLVASTTLMSCLKGDNNNQGSNDTVAGLMAFNLATDKPSVALGLSGSSLTNVPLAYTSYTGTYLRIYPGTRTIEAFDNTSAAPFASTSYNFEQDKYYSAFVAGANGNYRNIVVNDNFDRLTSANGQAYVRYINAIPDSARPNVVITANGASVVNEQAAFASVSAFKAVNAGSISIDVSNGTTIDTDRTITVEAKKVYTILLTGVAGSTTTPVQIKFIANGQLDEASGQRVSATGRSASSN